ncbi:MAG: hypothetical protein COT84_03270 [Chlamydiae bacterium CG10_big_fil_rev_8_21_14_0_10_35_9]|nr:MAG: hypothetical protein COT84_03270 [Chlamydiae bacterium CG10_big_fil_rev_8_21_14_0_10_35_9]
MTAVTEKKSLASEFETLHAEVLNTYLFRDKLRHEMHQFKIDIDYLNRFIKITYSNGTIAISDLERLVGRAIQFDLKLVDIHKDMAKVKKIAAKVDALIARTSNAANSFSVDTIEPLKRANPEEGELVFGTHMRDSVNLMTLELYQKEFKRINEQFIKIRDHTFLSLANHITELKNGQSPGSFVNRLFRYNPLAENYEPGTFKEQHKDGEIQDWEETPTPAATDKAPENPSDDTKEGVSASNKSSKKLRKSRKT